MRKTFWICTLFLAPGVIFAQGSGGLSFKESIVKEINNNASEYYYSNLLKKADSNSLSGKDYFYLYYGYLYNKDYNLRKSLPHPKLGNFMRYISKNKCNNALPVGMDILADNPVDLTVLWHIYSCIKSNNIPDNHNLITRFEGLVQAILSTGDGRSMENAIKITNFQDDYVLKGLLGFIGGQKTLPMNGKRSYIVWTNNDQKIFFEILMNVKYPE